MEIDYILLDELASNSKLKRNNCLFFGFIFIIVYMGTDNTSSLYYLITILMFIILLFIYTVINFQHMATLKAEAVLSEINNGVYTFKDLSTNLNISEHETLGIFKVYSNKPLIKGLDIDMKNERVTPLSYKSLNSNKVQAKQVDHNNESTVFSVERPNHIKPSQQPPANLNFKCQTCGSSEYITISTNPIRIRCTYCDNNYKVKQE